MEIIIPVIIMILIFITCSICGYCCKRNKQGIVYGVAQPTVTTTHTQQYNVGSMPQTAMGAPAPGFAPHAAYPPTMPYPQTTPYPPTTGSGFSGNTPYPPMPMPGSGAYTAPVPPYPTQSAGSHQLPPSYAEAVRQPPTNELYAKQSPYNPNYN